MSEKNIKLVIAEKPSVAQSIAKVIGADKREDGYLEGKTEAYKYKSEIISDERAFYTNEKMEMTGLCDKFLNDEIDKDSFYDGLKGYLNHYYENRYELRNQPGSVREKSNDMLDKLQHMFGV